MVATVQLRRKTGPRQILFHDSASQPTTFHIGKIIIRCYLLALIAPIIESDKVPPPLGLAHYLHLHLSKRIQESHKDLLALRSARVWLEIAPRCKSRECRWAFYIIWLSIAPRIGSGSSSAPASVRHHPIWQGSFQPKAYNSRLPTRNFIHIQ